MCSIAALVHISIIVKNRFVKNKNFVYCLILINNFVNKCLAAKLNNYKFYSCTIINNNKKMKNKIEQK